MLNRIFRQKRAIGIVEYALFLSIAVGAFLLAERLLNKGFQGNIKNMTDSLMGAQQLGKTSPVNITGGRQLATVHGVYDFGGVTNTERNMEAKQRQSSDGSRSIMVMEELEEKSPGPGYDDGDFKIKPLNDYKLEDKERPKTYVPPFVKAEEGFIEVPQRN